jgi:ABC-type molybdate transport system permease subunit
VQPVLEELDSDVEEAAASLGASRFTIFRRIILPSLVPAIFAGAALSFARAISEFGSLVLLSGSRPNDTEVVSVRVLSFIENGSYASAAALASIPTVPSRRVKLFGASSRSSADSRKSSGEPPPRCGGAMVVPRKQRHRLDGNNLQPEQHGRNSRAYYLLTYRTQ